MFPPSVCCRQCVECTEFPTVADSGAAGAVANLPLPPPLCGCFRSVSPDVVMTSCGVHLYVSVSVQVASLEHGAPVGDMETCKQQVCSQRFIPGARFLFCFLFFSLFGVVFPHLVVGQAKMILKTLSHRSPQRMSIDSGPYVFKCVFVFCVGVCDCGEFQLATTTRSPCPCVPVRRSYIIDEGICFMSLCEKSYPKRLCFSFLDELRDVFFTELQKDYGDQLRSRHRRRRQFIRALLLLDAPPPPTTPQVARHCRGCCPTVRLHQV